MLKLTDDKGNLSLHRILGLGVVFAGSPESFGVQRKEATGQSGLLADV